MPLNITVVANKAGSRAQQQHIVIQLGDGGPCLGIPTGAEPNNLHTTHLHSLATAAKHWNPHNLLIVAY